MADRCSNCAKAVGCNIRAHVKRIEEREGVDLEVIGCPLWSAGRGIVRAAVTLVWRRRRYLVMIAWGLTLAAALLLGG